MFCFKLSGKSSLPPADKVGKKYTIVQFQTRSVVGDLINIDLTTIAWVGPHVFDIPVVCF